MLVVSPYENGLQLYRDIKQTNTDTHTHRVIIVVIIEEKLLTNFDINWTLISNIVKLFVFFRKVCFSFFRQKNNECQYLYFKIFTVYKPKSRLAAKMTSFWHQDVVKLIFECYICISVLNL